MHLLVLIAFTLLLWEAEQPSRWILVSDQDVLVTLLVSLLPILAVGLGAMWTGRRSLRMLAVHPDAPQVAHDMHLRWTLILRVAALGFFAASLFLTHWPEWFSLRGRWPALQIAGDAVVIAPFCASIIAIWLASYPFERALRGGFDLERRTDQPAAASGWRLGTYLDFHLRHHLLIVVVPMTIILFAANMTRGYEEPLRAWTGWVWAPDLLLGVTTAAVFIGAPVMLRRIWHTRPLDQGEVRERLEALCSRIGLRCRDILVWHSDGIMINAAVMGLFPPVRYVLLSDALLSTMNLNQIEAVFGHEVGHVRHRHIQHFLVFALIGWFAVAGIMEWASGQTADRNSSARGFLIAIQGVGIAISVLFWGLGFGWLSRRFERQADKFGAECVTPEALECRLPCSVHLGATPAHLQPGRLCMTGAAIFASALDRVAALNGIPHEERSWRHSSIGSRIRFLMSLAGDPGKAVRFDRAIRRVKAAMLLAAVVGALISGYYWLDRVTQFSG